MTRPTVLVATWCEGLFAVTGDERTQEIVDQPVRGLAPDGRGGALAVVGGHSLWRRGASGEWSIIARSEFELSCCMAVGEVIYVGTDDARMLRLSDGVLYPLESFDNIAGRDAWFAGSAIINGQRVGPPLGIRSVAANSNGTVLLANVHVGGIPRSVDGGITWQATIDMHSDVHEVCAHPANPDIVVAASAAGLCVSRDAGATWTIEHEGLHARHCSAVAFSGDDVFVSASTDPFAAEGRIYRRPLRADGCIVAVEGLPPWLNGTADTGCIASEGSVIAVVDKAGTVYSSTDFGLSWLRGGKVANPSSILIC